MTILHGDDQIASRKNFLDLKDRAQAAGKQLVDLDGAHITLPDLVTAAESTSLLGTSNAVFIENLYTRRPSNDKKALIDYLETHSVSDITVWEPKDVTAQLKALSLKQITKFDLPKSIWKFIDTWDLTAYHQALASNDPEQILALLAKRLQDLLLVQEGVTDAFASWQ